MKIKIQTYWDIKAQSIQAEGKLTPEETINRYGDICICDVVIDKKFIGSVMWDGKKLFIKTIKGDK